MSNQVLTVCPICTHQRRREIDSEIIFQVESNKTEPEILKALAVFCAEKDLTLTLNEAILAQHLKKHPLVGLIGVANVRGGGIIRLPSGEKIDVNDTKSVLRTLLVMGMANVMEHPEEVTLARTIRIAELLLRPDYLNKDTEREELYAVLLGKLKEKAPLTLDVKQNPYAAPSNVGKMTDEQ